MYSYSRNECNVPGAPFSARHCSSISAVVVQAALPTKTLQAGPGAEKVFSIVEVELTDTYKLNLKLTPRTCLDKDRRRGSALEPSNAAPQLPTPRATLDEQQNTCEKVGFGA